MSVVQNRDQDAILRTAKQACEDWEYDPETLKKLGNCENVVFKVTDKSGTPYIVRVTEPIHRSQDEIQAEVDFIAALKSKGLPVCAAVKIPKEGAEVKTYTDQKTGQDYHVAVFDYAPGESFDHKKHWNLDLAKTLGRLMAEFHKASQKLSPVPKRKTYLEAEHVKNATKYIPAKDKIAREEWKQALSWVKSLDQNDQNFGLCHTDMHFGNFFVTDQGKVTVFDFDDTNQNFFLYDLMIPFIHVEDFKKTHQGSADPDFEIWQDMYLKTYADEMGIKDVAALKNAVQQFARLRDIEMYAWVHMMGYAEDEKKYLERARKKMSPKTPFKSL